MEAGQQVSGWSRAAQWFGIVALVLATLSAIPDNLNGKPLWERNDPPEAKETLTASTSLAGTLVGAATVVGVVGVFLSLAGMRQYLVSQIISPGKVVGLGRAFAGMLLSGLSASVLVYAAVKQQAPADPLVFVAAPAGLALLIAGLASWWWRRSGNSILAALTPAEPGVAPDRRPAN